MRAGWATSHHSVRNARVDSTRAARHAGTRQATAAVPRKSHPSHGQP